jgi:hypothetical protein
MAAPRLSLSRLLYGHLHLALPSYWVCERLAVLRFSGQTILMKTRRIIIFIILVLILIYDVFFKTYFYNQFFSGITTFLYLPAYILAFLFDAPVCKYFFTPPTYVPPIQSCTTDVSPLFASIFFIFGLILAWFEAVLLDKLLSKAKK